MAKPASATAGAPAGVGSTAESAERSDAARGGLEAAAGQAVALEGVDVAFDGFKALNDLSLEVGRGERVAIIGASGAGKSTLFNVLTRALPVAAGRVLVEGADLMAAAPEQLRAMRRRIGVIYQSYGLVPQLSAGMNVALGELTGLSNRAALRALVRGPGAETSARVVAALEQVGLAERLGDRVTELSGGQQQRVAVARLLVQQPALVLADEPVAAVDPVTGKRVLHALLELADERTTLLVSLHDVALARRFPRVVALRDGSVVFDGPPEGIDDAMLEAVYDEAGSAPFEPDLEPGAQPAATSRCDPLGIALNPPRHQHGLRPR